MRTILATWLIVRWTIESDAGAFRTRRSGDAHRARMLLEPGDRSFGRQRLPARYWVRIANAPLRAPLHVGERQLRTRIHVVIPSMIISMANVPMTSAETRPTTSM